ncbi:hypothetical protein HN924_02480 [Candidatus Woesearchaeota archaeon]|jgi:hypothetical protein|nr:hypothetical protein [Candidatus Woesearchaeota archaeon]MBT7062811.1 hypothetical protein [Candidatus Woesearchaeota archaeon]MBT7403027.1 hypothetical protein [Candidatus Woesearchaeota archaeon]
MINVSKTQLENKNYKLKFTDAPEQDFSTRLYYHTKNHKWYILLDFEDLPKNAHFEGLNEKTNKLGINFRLGFKKNTTNNIDCTIELKDMIFFENKNQDYLLGNIFSTHIKSQQYQQKPKPRQVAPKFFVDDAKEKKLKTSLNEEIGEGFTFYQ